MNQKRLEENMFDKCLRMLVIERQLFMTFLPLFHVQDVMSSRKKKLRCLGSHYNAVTSIKNDTLKYMDNQQK